MVKDHSDNEEMTLTADTVCDTLISSKVFLYALSQRHYCDKLYLAAHKTFKFISTPCTLIPVEKMLDYDNN